MLHGGGGGRIALITEYPGELRERIETEFPRLLPESAPNLVFTSSTIT